MNYSERQTKLETLAAYLFFTLLFLVISSLCGKCRLVLASTFLSSSALGRASLETAEGNYDKLLNRNT